MLWKFIRFEKNELASDNEIWKKLAERKTQRARLDCWLTY
jgi:hypothetical protein